MNPGSTPPAPADAAGTGTPTPSVDAGAGTSGQSDDGRWKDVFKFRDTFKQELGELKALVKGLVPPQPKQESAAPPPPADAAMSEIAELKRSLAVKEVFADFGLKPGPQRELLEMALDKARPEDPRAFVQKYLSAIAPAAPTTAAPPQAPPRSNTGAPGAGDKANLPADPRLIRPDIWASLSKDERREINERFQRASGGNSNPYASARKLK